MYCKFFSFLFSDISFMLLFFLYYYDLSKILNHYFFIYKFVHMICFFELLRDNFHIMFCWKLRTIYFFHFLYFRYCIINIYFNGCYIIPYDMILGFFYSIVSLGFAKRSLVIFYWYKRRWKLKEIFVIYHFNLKKKEKKLWFY